jgi:plasmid replication initiation protein
MTEKPKVLKSKTKKIYKSNKLNTANFANFNLNDYRVYLNAIALIGGVTAQGKYIQTTDLPREYRLSALEFSKQFNVAPNNAYKILKQATDKLMKTDIRIEGERKITRINVCEKAEYNEKEGTIDILFTGSIMEHLKQKFKKDGTSAIPFTLYNLKEIADLTSIYAVRLYEYMQQWNTTSGMLIATIEKWREMLGVQPEQYKLYGHLKDKVFTQALEEINLKTGYKLVMTEIKEGRKVVRVQFDFTPDMVYSGTDPRTGETVDRHIKPKTKKLTAEEKLKLEAKRAKEKEYRERHKAKKLAAMQAPKIIRDIAEYALEKEFEQSAFTEVDPNQLELEI